MDTGYLKYTHPYFSIALLRTSVAGKPSGNMKATVNISNILSLQPLPETGIPVWM
jgi:hypothetical protein